MDDGKSPSQPAPLSAHDAAQLCVRHLLAGARTVVEGMPRIFLIPRLTPSTCSPSCKNFMTTDRHDNQPGQLARLYSLACAAGARSHSVGRRLPGANIRQVHRRTMRHGGRPSSPVLQKAACSAVGWVLQNLGWMATGAATTLRNWWIFIRNRHLIEH